jgi:hypothetical protein
VFVRQGKFANDPKIVAAFPGAANVTVDRIGDLLNYSSSDLVAASAKAS